MWSEGSIRIGNEIFHFWVKHFKEPSVYGIDLGRISKLTIQQGGRCVCSYDREWELEPTSKAASDVLALLMNEYN